MAAFGLVVRPRVGVLVLALQRRYRDGGVDLRRGDGDVAQKFLHDTYIGAVRQHVRGTTVAKDVGADARTFDPDGERAFIDDEVNPLARQVATTCVEE